MNHIQRRTLGRGLPLIGIFEQGMRLGLIRDADAGIMTKLIKRLVTIAVHQAFVVSGGRDADKFREACADMVLAYMQSTLPPTVMSGEMARERERP